SKIPYSIRVFSIDKPYDSSRTKTLSKECDRKAQGISFSRGGNLLSGAARARSRRGRIRLGRQGRQVSRLLRRRVDSKCRARRAAGEQSLDRSGQYDRAYVDALRQRAAG